jgi:hypothetical protein
MRKRKTKATPSLSQESSSSSSSSSSSTRDTTGLQVPASKWTKSSIIWDEERCRIVYEPVPVLSKNKNNNAITTQEEDDDDDVSGGDATSCFWETSYDMEEEEPTVVPRVSMEKPADLAFPMQEELKAVVAASSTINATGKGRRGGKRSYASRKRVLLQSPPLNEAVLDVQAHCNNRRPSKRTKKNDDDNDDESKLVDTESGTSLHTILSQESVSHEEEEDPLEGAIVEGESAASESSTEEDIKAPSAPPSQPEPSSLFDFDDTEQEKSAKTKVTSKRPKRASRTQQQPSSKTSVEKARCYFEQLDAKEQLTLDNSRTPPSVAAGNVNKACIRTRRRLVDTKVEDPVVLNEYQDYVTACQESGVTPRPVQSTFFRTTAVYDGFLDE